MDFDFNKFYNMTPMRYYQPQNYKSAKAIDMIENKGGKYIATQKNDGEWARLIVDMNGDVTIQSRSISKVTGEYGNKTLHVPHIVEEAKNILPKGTVLLGELCFDDITATSQKVGSILRCLPEKAVARQKDEKDKLRFKVFDCLAADSKDCSDETFERRLFLYAQNQVSCKPNRYITMTDIALENFEDFLFDILERGGEGMVIYDETLPYMPGNAKAWTTLKVKKITEEIELPVTATMEPVKVYGGNSPVWKYVLEDGTHVTKRYFNGWKNGVVVDNKGVAVNITSGLNDEDAEWLASAEAAETIERGELFAVVQCMEITADGSMRHPRLIRLRNEV